MSILKNRFQENGRLLTSSVAVSIGLHLVVMLALVFSASFSFGSRSAAPVLPVMNVNMISLGDSRGETGLPAPVIQAPSKPEADPAPVAAPPPAPQADVAAVAPVAPAPNAEQPKISLKHETLKIPEPSMAPRADQPKTSLKHATFQPDKAMQQALARLEQEVAQTTPQETPATDPESNESLEDALARLRAQVGDTGLLQNTGSGTGRGGGRSTPQQLRSIDIYRAMLPGHIEHNWAFNPQLTGGQSDLSAIIMIRIARSGEIQDIWFEKKSGNRFLDDSADNAVRKSNPLPPLPSDYPQSHYTLGLIFTAAGLSRS